MTEEYKNTRRRKAITGKNDKRIEKECMTARHENKERMATEKN